MKPRDYQQSNIDEIIEKFKINDRLLYQLSTGGGKTVVFSFLAKEWIKRTGKKVLILCHREELINQACETLVKVGLSVERVLPNVKRYHHKADVYVAMIETLDRRLKRNPKFLFNVGLVVADECHIQIFNKVYDFFPDAKILGVTATPVILGRDTYWKCDRCQSTSIILDECCNMEMIEWSKPRSLSNVYEDIVVGPSIQYLIDNGSLVKEISFIEKFGDLSNLEVDATGDFSAKSQDDAFGSGDAVFNVALNYEKYAIGKRTIIFNNSTKNNLKVYDQFISKGYNAKLYDSVNDTEGSRKSLVEWFRNTPDAILLNCGVFVAGLDVKEIQFVILNVATLSLSKFLQMAGRGGRPSDLIFKDSFGLIDGGGNIDRFDPWSSDTRDWQKIFFEGIGKDRAKKEAPMNVQECDECGFLYPRSEGVCPNCGHKVPTKEKKEQSLSESVLVPLEKIPLPNGKKILEYTLRRGENIHFAFKILASQILDQFIFNSVSKELYLSTLANGKLDKRIGELCRKTYFILISAPEFKSDSNRTLSYVIKKTKEKIAKHYNHESVSSK